MEDKRDKKDKSKLIILILLLITIISILITIWALFFRPVERIYIDYNTPVIDANAQRIKGDTGKNTDTSTNTVRLNYSDKVTIDQSMREAYLQLQNPSQSNQHIVIELIVDGITVGESGEVLAGYEINKITDLDLSQIDLGEYKGNLLISHYDAATGEKSIVKSSLAVDVSIIE